MGFEQRDLMHFIMQFRLFKHTYTHKFKYVTFLFAWLLCLCNTIQTKIPLPHNVSTGIQRNSSAKVYANKVT